MRTTFTIKTPAQREHEVDREVDNMTAQQLYDFAVGENTDDLCTAVAEIAMAAIDRDWASVEAHTKELIEAVKAHMIHETVYIK